MLRGELGGQPLKLLPHGVKLGHLRVVERCHDQRPAVAGQQALGLKPLQGLAHGVRLTPKRSASSLSTSRSPGR
jgi:hypothetical protein